MIAKSDLIILSLCTAFLVAGILRWQHNTSVVPVVTIPASSKGASVNAASGQKQDFAPVVTRLPARSDEDEVAPSTNRGLRSVEPDATSDSNAQRVPAATEAELVPQAATATTSDTSSPVSDPSPELLGTYTVVPGDYLGWIAEEFGTTIAALKEINGLDGNDIRIGQKIKYPLPN